MELVTCVLHVNAIDCYNLSSVQCAITVPTSKGDVSLIMINFPILL